MTRRLATVFGGTGFLGRHIVERLAKDGWRVRVAVRDAVAADFLKPVGDVGQIVPLSTNITNDVSVQAAVEGADLVVNAVGILFPKGRNNFQAVHVDGPARIAKAAAKANVGKLIHISAIGADKSSDAGYASSKGVGEEAVRAAYPNATILRPSVVFGPEDGFFNMFARMAALSPVMPVFVTDGFRKGSGPCLDIWGSGGPKLQPVYVGDVALAVAAAANSSDSDGKTYELGGPRVMSLKDIIELVVKTSGRRRALLPIPIQFAALQAKFLQYLPTPPLTPDQVKMLSVPNVVDPGALGLADLGVAATAAEVIVPTYLGAHKSA